MSIYSIEQLQELQSKIDILEFYKKYLPDIQERGNNRGNACCCFHGETKGSLFVDLETGVFHCFGCKASGNLFQFYQKYHGLTFGEAVQEIADEYNYSLEIDPEVQKERNYKKSLYSINKKMCSKYKMSLEQNVNAYNYLTKIRGISPKMVEFFELGCGIDRLPTANSLQLLGLQMVNQETNQSYSKFRKDRVIIPFKDEYGNVISFSGRLHEDKDNCAKYMFTSNTDIFTKGDYLYGLYESKKYIKQFNKVVLVEGQMDVIKMYQKGLVYTVGLGGLNLSDNQVLKLRKYTNNFYICLEDEAMLRVENKTTPLAKIYEKIKEHIPYAKIYIIDLRKPDGSKCDPDEFLNTHPKSDFDNLIKKAKIYNEFLINSKISKINPKNIEEKSACLNYLVPILADIQSFMDRKQYIELVSNKLMIPENDIYKKIKFYNDDKNKIKIENIKYDDRFIYAQKMLISMCFCKNFNSYYVAKEISLKTLFNMDDFYRNIFNGIAQYIIKMTKDNRPVDYKEYLSGLTNGTSEVNQELLNTVMDCYMKTEMFEDFDQGDVDELIEEQNESLCEYVQNQENSLNNI